jgi:hypothetical protein
MKQIKMIFFTVLVLVLLYGCTGIAVMPAKIVYMYPVGENYAEPAANGAVAKVDNGILSLYLPTFTDDAIKPQRFEFTWSQKKQIWEERRGNAIIESVTKDRDQTLSSGKILHLKTNMIIVKFAKEPRYGALAGKMIWLTANVGPKEFKKITGIYIDRDASYQDIFNQPGDVTGVLRK